jgi:hypothetical protein
MSLINVISVPTSNGIKTIEVHCADITQLSWSFDMLIVSAYHNKYNPAPGTVIEALEKNLCLTLSEYARTPLLDFRNTLHCWLSKPIAHQNFKHILCVEGIRTAIEKDGNSNSAISDLFGFISFIQFKDLDIQSIAMPILGSGFQQNTIDRVLPDLIRKAIEALNRNTGLKTIYFVENDRAKAEMIDQTINTLWNRDKEKIELFFDDASISASLDEVLSKLILIRNEHNKFERSKTFKNLIQKIQDRELRFFELGIFTRKLLESMVPELSHLKSDRYIPLYEHLNELKSKNVAEWMITYLHTLRVFGNFLAHEEKPSEIPKHIEKKDIVVFTYALNRFLDFYISVNRSQEKQG